MVAVILEAVDAPAGLQRDQVARLAGFEKRAVDVGAVGDRIRLVAEALGKRGIERNMGDQLAGEGVAHFLRRRHMGIGEDRLLEPDLLQHAEDIGAELDAGADLAEFRRLLEQAHRKAAAGQRIGRDQAADAAAGDQKRRRAAIAASHEPSLVVLGSWEETLEQRPVQRQGCGHGNEKPAGCVAGGFPALPLKRRKPNYFVNCPRISPALLAAVWMLT